MFSSPSSRTYTRANRPNGKVESVTSSMTIPNLYKQRNANFIAFLFKQFFFFYIYKNVS